MDFKGLHILVAGEVGLDEYIWGDTRRISPEAPVPVVEVERSEFKLGLAANVAQNIASLGAKVSLVSVVGNDEDAKTLQHLLSSNGIDGTHLVADRSRPTLRKSRVIAQRQHVVRIDYERTHSLDAEVAEKFVAQIDALLNTVDAVIVQDYGKGIWRPNTIAFVARAKKLGKPVFVDPNRHTPVALYSGVTLLTPNTAEAQVLAGALPLPSSSHAAKDDLYLAHLAEKILKETKAEHIVITCGEAGMVSLSSGSSQLTRIPTFARDVFDVTGAGDTVVAVLALAYCRKQPLKDCMRIANAAAGLVVGKLGAATVTPTELQQELGRISI